jgi:hypothetical protein
MPWRSINIRNVLLGLALVFQVLSFSKLSGQDYIEIPVPFASSAAPVGADAPGESTSPRTTPALRGTGRSTEGASDTTWQAPVVAGDVQPGSSSGSAPDLVSIVDVADPTESGALGEGRGMGAGGPGPRSPAAAPSPAPLSPAPSAPASSIAREEPGGGGEPSAGGGDPPEGGTDGKGGGGGAEVDTNDPPGGVGTDEDIDVGVIP